MSEQLGECLAKADLPQRESHDNRKEEDSLDKHPYNTFAY